MAAVKLSDLVGAALGKYKPLDIEIEPGVSVALRPILLLSKADRAALQAEKDDAGNEVDVDVVDTFAKWARVVASDKDAAELLVDAVGENLAAWKEIQDAWAEATQPGEAKPSDS